MGTIVRFLDILVYNVVNIGTFRNPNHRSLDEQMRKTRKYFHADIFMKLKQGKNV